MVGERNIMKKCIVCIKKVAICLLVIGAIIAIPPIILNFIIAIPRLPNIEVVGEDIHWLSFFGSYIGCVLSAVVSFSILYMTIKSSQQQHTIDLLHEELLYFHNDMANRFSQYNISEALNLSVAAKPTIKQFAEEEIRLQTLLGKYNSLFCSAELLYSHIPSKEFQDFYNAYRLQIEKSQKIIKELIEFYSNCIGTWKEKRNWVQPPKEQKDIFTYRVTEFGEKIEKLSDENQIVLFLGRILLDWLNTEVNSMQKYKNLFNKDFINRKER